MTVSGMMGLLEELVLNSVEVATASEELLLNSVEVAIALEELLLDSVLGMVG